MPPELPRSYHELPHELPHDLPRDIPHDLPHHYLITMSHLSSCKLGLGKQLIIVNICDPCMTMCGTR